MLPDVVDDKCVQAARNMGCQFMETFFFRAALEAGFGLRSEDEAKKLHHIWTRHLHGFQDLPLWVKNFARMKTGLKAITFSETPIKK